MLSAVAKGIFIVVIIIMIAIIFEINFFIYFLLIICFINYIIPYFRLKINSFVPLIAIFSNFNKNKLLICMILCLTDLITQFYKCNKKRTSYLMLFYLQYQLLSFFLFRNIRISKFFTPYFSILFICYQQNLHYNLFYITKKTNDK